MANRYAKPVSEVRARALERYASGFVRESAIPSVLNEAIEVYNANEEVASPIVTSVERINRGGWVTTKELEKLLLALGTEMAVSKNPVSKAFGTKCISQVHSRREQKARLRERLQSRDDAYRKKRRADSDYVTHKHKAALDAAFAAQRERVSKRIALDRETMTP